MDANNRESAADVSTGSGTAARMKRNIADTAQDAKETLNEIGRKTADRIEHSRESTANALERTATSLHSGAEQVSEFTHSAANRLQNTADYLREKDLDRMAEDLRGIVKRYPGRSLAAAAILGFLIARGLRRIG
jgi:methyl-accepting chemotaxis protein